MIRTAIITESLNLLELAEATGIFKPGEAETLLGGVLDAYFTDQLGEGHEVDVSVNETTQSVEGWVYYAPSSHAEGVYDLWWIGVHPKDHKKGIGSKLMAHVEAVAKAAGARILIVETSASDLLRPTRQFYAKKGYLNCGEIPDFFAEGEGKVTFMSKLSNT